MTDMFRNLRMHWHDWRGTPSAELRGVRLCTDRSIPKAVRRLIFKGGYEKDEAALVSVSVQPGDRVVEIGAGIGFVSILAAKRAGPGRVTSYEANPAMAETLAKNHALNGLDPDIRLRAVTADGRALIFHQAQNVLSSSLVDRGAEAGPSQPIEIASDAIDTVIDTIVPDVIIMDIEGAEEEVLPRAAARKIPRLMVEFHPHIIGSDRTKRLRSLMQDHGYREIGQSGANTVFALNDAEDTSPAHP